MAHDIRLDLAPYSKLPWLNNLEKDKRLSGASRSISALMQVTFIDTDFPYRHIYVCKSSLNVVIMPQTCGNFVLC